MKSMCKHWGFHISTNINRLGAVLGSFWAVWKGLLWCLKQKLRSWRFPRYWRFNKRYHGGYQLICLISRPILIALRRDWYRSKGFLKGFKLALRPWESSKNWWRYGWMKFVTKGAQRPDLQQCKLPAKEGSTATWHTIYKLTVALLLEEGSTATWLTTVQITSEGREHSNLMYNLQTDCGLTVGGREHSNLTYNSAYYQWRKRAKWPDVQFTNWLWPYCWRKGAQRPNLQQCILPVKEESKVTWRTIYKLTVALLL